MSLPILYCQFPLPEMPLLMWESEINKDATQTIFCNKVNWLRVHVLEAT